VSRIGTHKNDKAGLQGERKMAKTPKKSTKKVSPRSAGTSARSASKADSADAKASQAATRKTKAATGKAATGKAATSKAAAEKSAAKTATVGRKTSAGKTGASARTTSATKTASKRGAKAATAAKTAGKATTARATKTSRGTSAKTAKAGAARTSRATAKATTKPAAKTATKTAAKTAAKATTKATASKATASKAKSAKATSARAAKSATAKSATKSSSRSAGKTTATKTAATKSTARKTATAKTAAGKATAARKPRTAATGKAAAAKVTAKATGKSATRKSATGKAATKTAATKTAARTTRSAKPDAKPAKAAKAASKGTSKTAAKISAKAASKTASKGTARTTARSTTKGAGKRAGAAADTPALPASRPTPRAGRSATASRRAALAARRTPARPLTPAAEETSAPAKPTVPAVRPTALPPATRRTNPPPVVRRQAVPMVIEPTGAKGSAKEPAKPRSILSRRKGAMPNGVKVLGKMAPRFEEILTPEALEFIAALHRRFDGRRRELLRARTERQARFDAGELPDFLPETKHIRHNPWKVAPIPADLQDRRVEITGPTDRKMIINALNSGAKVFMADFEDATSPTWANVIEGQINLKDRWHGAVFDHTDPDTGKRYELGDNPAVLIVRPRGLHLVERHVEVDGRPVPGSLLDFGLYAFHNAKAALAEGSGPYLYLPKLESHLEARLWNEVFLHTESALGLHRGTIKATVLIETLPAAFEMHEILHELRDHVAGLNCGRWDYIFSFIKKLAKNDAFVLPDRSQVVMGKAFLKAYSQLLIQTCHQRGAFAMGGMAAQIPVKDDQERNEAAFAKVRADKEREAGDGHDGTWVAHPDLVPVAMEVFDRLMPGRNQLDELREDVDVGQAELLEVHQGTRTEAGFRENIRVGVRYIEAWLRGKGAVPIYGLMEDAATAEIARAQIWQWITYGAKLDDGTQVTPAFFERALHEEMETVRQEVGEERFEYGRFPEAISLFHRLSLAAEFEEFLTLPAYALID
jgi:malate synthase